MDDTTRFDEGRVAATRWTPVRRVGALTAVVVLAVAGSLVLLSDGMVLARTNFVVVAALVAGFTLSEKLIFHIEARRDSISYTPSEIGIAIGVVLLFPLELIGARIIGALVGLLIWRRGPWFKMAFTLAQFAFESLSAVIVFRAISSFSDDLLVVWGALLIAVVVANTAGGTLVAAAIGQFERDVASRVRRELVGTPIFHVPPAAVASSIAVAFLVDPRLGLIALTPAPAIWVMIRAHGALMHRHLDLTSVHDFGRTLADLIELEEMASTAANHLAEGSRASQVGLRLWGSDGSYVDATADTDFDTSALPATLSDAHWVRLLTRRETERVTPTPNPTSHAAQLAKVGIEHAIVAPISDERGVLGVVVLAGRKKSDPAFDDDDLDRVVRMIQQLGAAVRRSRFQAQVRHEAAHDRLTGLPNRSQFEAWITESVLPGQDMAVLAIDLDRFKEINDSFGHQAGDRVLVEAARRIEAAAGPTAVAARFGGDEFAVAIRDTDAVDASLLAEVICTHMEQPIDIGQATVTVAASVGVAVAPDHATEPHQLLHRADLAMYDAKRTRSRTAVYHDDLHTSGETQMVLLSDLRRALQHEDLTLHYQPQIDLATGAVVGVEALARWEHPDYGPIDPRVFIGLAEQAGLIEELTRQVLVAATTAAAEWHRRGWPLAISVNVSAQSLMDERLESLVSDALHSSGLEPSRLVLEVTETTMMGDASRTHRTLHGLARLGVRLSVDDFGTGYSSLTNLRHFPVAEIKIDRSFVLDLMHGKTDDVIVRSTIELGHNLGLVVIAEGVEDPDVQDRLSELGCDLAQGYGICRPVTMDKICFWLAEQFDRGEVTDRPAAIADLRTDRPHRAPRRDHAPTSEWTIGDTI